MQHHRWSTIHTSRNRYHKSRIWKGLAKKLQIGIKRTIGCREGIKDTARYKRIRRVSMKKMRNSICCWMNLWTIRLMGGKRRKTMMNCFECLIYDWLYINIKAQSLMELVDLLDHMHRLVDRSHSSEMFEWYSMNWSIIFWRWKHYPLGLISALQFALLSIVWVSCYIPTCRTLINSWGKSF